MIDLLPKQIDVIRSILQTLPQGTEVFVFGSRASAESNKVKPASDLDLAIVAQQALSDLKLSELRERFDESDLPFRVDLVDWHRISSEFRTLIASTRVPFRL